MPSAKRDDGTPQLIVQTDSLFGQRTEKVEVDSNRLDPISTAQERAIAALVHPYLIDALGDAVCWLCAVAFLTSVALHTPLILYLRVPFLLTCTTLAIGGLVILFQRPELTGQVIFRVLLVIGGLIVGGVL